MDVRAPAAAIQDDEIRLKDLIQQLLRQKWLACAIILICTAGAAAAAFLSPKIYKATIVLLPATNTPGSQMGGLSSLISEFGGLASLAGLSVEGDARKQEAIAVLQSEALTERYIDQNHLLPILYHKLWDSKTQQWRVTDSLKRPTLWEGGQYFKRYIRSVTVETKSGLVRMTIAWRDPVLAADWANGLVRMTNDYLRGKAITESERNISYLNEQASKTDVVGVQQAIYTILENEIDKEMLARGTQEYAFKVVDPAIPPETPSSPLPLIWTLLGFVSGLVLSFCAAFMRLSWIRS